MSYETICVKIKLKPDSIEKVREWARVLNERKDEALETLRDESVVVECAFLDQTADGDYLISIMKAESFEKMREAVQKSTHEIDAYHQNFKRETWGERKQLELLVDLENFS